MARNSIATKYAINLSNENMQLQLKTLSDNPRNEYYELLKEILDNEKDELVARVFYASRGTNKAYLHGERLIKMFQESEDCLIPLLSDFNEECLNDPAFTQAILNGASYEKLIGTFRRDVLYYPPHSVDSKHNKSEMNLLYVPSRADDEPNRYRIEMVEHLAGQEEYPMISFSVDIGDDGSVTYNQPILSDKESEEADIISVPCDMSRTHINLNEKGIEALREMFGYIFEKTSTKDFESEFDNIKTSLS